MKCAFLLISVLGTLSYVQADCYPGDTQYTQIVEEIYHGVTSDRISLSAHDSSSITRRALCEILIERHNEGTNPGMNGRTNRNYLGPGRRSYIPLYKCLIALTYTRGYETIAGWEKWSGYHSGTWYKTSSREDSSDGAYWYYPYATSGYVFQKVRFDSRERIQSCTMRDSTDATCRYGWNQSGAGVRNAGLIHAYVMYITEYIC